MFLQWCCKICERAHSFRNSIFLWKVSWKVITRATPGRSLVNYKVSSTKFCSYSFFLFPGYSGGRRDSLDRNSAFSPSLMDQFNKNKGGPSWPNAYGNLGSLAAGKRLGKVDIEHYVVQYSIPIKIKDTHLVSLSSRLRRFLISDERSKSIYITI